MKLNPPEPKQLIHNMYFLQIQSPGGLFLKRKVITKQVTSYARYKNVMNNTWNTLVLRRNQHNLHP